MRWNHFSFLGWMALGSVASAAGFMLVLQGAKQERVGLEERVASLEATVAQHEDEKNRLADRANRQVEAATQELTRAREAVERMKHDQLLLAQALPLARPNGRGYASWAEAFSLPLGISLKLPPGSRTYADERGLVALRADQTTSSLPWLSISPYSAEQASRLESALRDPEAVSYLVAGNLVTGLRGRREEQTTGYTYVLQIVSPATGQTTHLIWAQTVPEISDSRIRDTLATLDLRT